MCLAMKLKWTYRAMGCLSRTRAVVRLLLSLPRCICTWTGPNEQNNKQKRLCSTTEKKLAVLADVGTARFRLLKYEVVR